MFYLFKRFLEDFNSGSIFRRLCYLVLEAIFYYFKLLQRLLADLLSYLRLAINSSVIHLFFAHQSLLYMSEHSTMDHFILLLSLCVSRY